MSELIAFTPSEYCSSRCHGAGGGGGRGDREVIGRALGDQGDLPGLLVPLLDSADTGLAVLALQILEMLLRCSPIGVTQGYREVWNALEKLATRS